MYKLKKASNQLSKLAKTSLQENGLLERLNLEEWIAGSPDVLGEDLLVLATEHILPSKLRIDILALDASANIVVVELKRDWSGSDIDWQAIKYASYCSGLTVDQLASMLAERNKIDVEGARHQIEDFIGEELEEDKQKTLNQDQRIILVAGEFHPDVISAVLWLREYDVDLRCVRLRCFSDEEGAFFINPEVIIPLPEAEDFVKRKEAKVQRRRTPDSSLFSLEVENLGDSELSARLLATLNRRDSDLTPRFAALLEILSSEARPFSRDEIKKALLKRGIGKDIGQSGRFLSNLSQFITKPKNSHLRQLIKFEGGELPGRLKDRYCLEPKYRTLVSDALTKWKNSAANDSELVQTAGLNGAAIG